MSEENKPKGVTPGQALDDLHFLVNTQQGLLQVHSQAILQLQEHIAQLQRQLLNFLGHDITAPVAALSAPSEDFISPDREPELFEDFDSGFPVKHVN